MWVVYLSKEDDPEKRLLAYSSILDNDLIVDNKDKLLKTGKTVEKIFALQKQVGKYQEDFSGKIKQFFSQVGVKQKLNSKEKKEYLLSLYQKYNSIYSKDVDILLATAELAENLQQYVLAGDLLRLISGFFKKPEKKENIAVKQIELAELTKEDDVRLKAYQFYVEHGSNPSLIFKAKYQMAYLAYSNKEFQKASESFDKLALSGGGKEDKSIQELSLKSAHLSLSALDQLGNQEENLIKKAGLFMQRFPKSRQEFAGIYNSAILNAVEKLVSNKDFSHRPIQVVTDKDIIKAWEVFTAIFY